MTERDEAKQSESGRGSLLLIIVFVLVKNILAVWLIRPFALGATFLIVFSLLYPFKERKVTLTRWLLFSILIAFLFPAMIYGPAYLLCRYRLGAVIYGLLSGAFIFSMPYIMAGLTGEVADNQRWWKLVSLLIGITSGVALYSDPDMFCDGSLWGSG